MKHFIYLAGPFFNSQQNKHMDEVEAALNEAKLSHFSPRKSPASQELRMNGPSDAVFEAIFRDNLEMLNRCTVVLAMLDWQMPNGQRVVLQKLNDQHSWANLTDLNLPDSGTVWEMGFAHAHGKPVIGMHVGTGKCNLMLSRCCQQLVRSMDELKAVLKSLGGWKGAEF